MNLLRKQSVLNSIFLYLGLIIGFFNIIFIQPYLLETNEIGTIRVLHSICSIIAMILPLGIGSISIKYFLSFYNNKNGHNGLLGLLFIFTIIGTVIVFLILLAIDVFANFLFSGSKIIEDYIKHLLPISIFITFCSLFSIYSQLFNKSVFPTFLNEIVNRALSIVFVVGYYFNFYSFQIFIFLYFGVFVIQALCLFIYIFKFDNPSLKLNLSFLKKLNWKKFLSYSFFLTLISFISLGIKYLDLIMISEMLSLSIAGVYSVAMFIPTIIEAPIAALERIYNSEFAKKWHLKDLKSIQSIYQKSAANLLTIGGFIFINIITSKAYLFMLLPQQYKNGEIVMVILSISSLFNMTTGLNGSIILTSNKYKYGFFSLVLLFILLILLNIIFIPIYGILGAALSSLIASLIYNIIKFFVLFNNYKLQPFTSITFKKIGIIILSILVISIIPKLSQPIFGIFLNLILSSILYTTLLDYYRIIKIRLLVKLLKQFLTKMYQNQNQ